MTRFPDLRYERRLWRAGAQAVADGGGLLARAEVMNLRHK